MNLKALVKILLSLALIVIILQIIDTQKFIKTLLTIPSYTVLLVVTGYILGQMLSTYKWLLIARAGGINTTYKNALKSYFIGMFVNCFGLGIVGGDLARGILISSGQGKKTQAVASVVADRAHGLAVLATIGTISAIIFGQNFSHSNLLPFIIALGVTIIIGWFVGPRILLRVVPPTNKLRRIAEGVANAFPTDPKTVISITILSIMFHLLQIGLHWIMGVGLGISINFSLLLITIPFINIACSLPFSWNGLGVREFGYIFFLTPDPLVKEQALAFGALWLLSTTISSLIGGIVAVVTKNFNISQRAELAKQN